MEKIRWARLAVRSIGVFICALAVTALAGWHSGSVLPALLLLSVHLAFMAYRRAQALEKEMSEREQAEEALRQSEAKYRSLIENLDQGVFLKDRQLRYVAGNQHFCREWECDRSLLVGKSDRDFCPPDLAHQYARDDQLVLREGKRLEREEQQTLGGKTRTLRVIKTPVKDSRGEIVGVLGVTFDVTDQRNLEEQLRQAQKMEAIGQLAGGIAHDFNNLLTAVLGNISLILSNLSRSDPNHQLALAAEKAGMRAANLTTQLLGFSRQTPFHLQAANLNCTVDEVIGILARTVDPRIHLEAKKLEDLWLVQVDQGQMNQMLINLCLNARDAMPEGGRLLVETRNLTVDDEYARMHVEARPGEFVVLCVSDTGHGMPAEVRAHIFEPFFTTKGLGKGTGLGLAMVFGIVKQHHGWIECHSEINQGTRFDIYLPRCVARHDGPEPILERFVPRQGHETILLVDDEPLIRNLGKATLKRHGYTVVVAEDGKEAVEIYHREKERIDLVILDLAMPHLSGRETLRVLRQIQPQVRVLIASGHSREQLNEEDYRHILGFIGKPFRPDDLARAVRDALDINMDLFSYSGSKNRDCLGVTEADWAASQT